MLKPRYPYYLANQPVLANEALEVTDKFTNQVATRVALPDAKAIDAGTTAPTSGVRRWPGCRPNSAATC